MFVKEVQKLLKLLLEILSISFYIPYQFLLKVMFTHLKKKKKTANVI